MPDWRLPKVIWVSYRLGDDNILLLIGQKDLWISISNWSIQSSTHRCQQIMRILNYQREIRQTHNRIATMKTVTMTNHTNLSTTCQELKKSKQHSGFIYFWCRWDWINVNYYIKEGRKVDHTQQSKVLYWYPRVFHFPPHPLIVN